MKRFLFSLAGFLSLLPLAEAQSPPLTICTNLPGCGVGANNVISTTLIPNLAIVGLRVGAGLALVMIIFYGISLMVTTDEGGRTKAKIGVFYALLGLFFVLASGRIVGFIVTENYGQGNYTNFLYGGIFASAVRIMLGISNVIIVVSIFYNAYRMVSSNGKTDEFNSARTQIFWIIVGALIINISRVLVDVVLTMSI